MFLLAKLWRRRRPLSTKHQLPTLPPELWILILRHAADDHFTGPHGQLHASVSFLHDSSSHSDLLRRLTAYRSSLHCRAVLSRVCWQWHRIAQELLYEFVWVSRARQAKALASTLTQNHTLGTTIRRLHIETPTLERCDPADLRTIIDLSPRLAAYSDYRSIRRQPHSSPDHLLTSLARPGNKLQRLSWTNYDYDTRDQSGCISFFLRLSPALGMAASDLDYLELSLCATDLVSPSFSSFFPNPLGPTSIPVHLPALRTLKLTLDNITFSVLSHWSLPALRNLSVLSTDFSYTGDGFVKFFNVHGPNILQLELGHSTGAIEEHYLTTPPTHQSHLSSLPPHLNLADCCPNLQEFICSADAEWNWQSPDWIAPHLLLPSHPNVKLIGIRDINKRLLDDLDLYLVRHQHSSSNLIIPLPSSTQRGPFFRLAEQLSSLLRSSAFPALQTIRDMSWESALMRKSKRMPLPISGSPLGDTWDAKNKPTKSKEQLEFGGALIGFWNIVQDTCNVRGVEIQDWIGQPVKL